MSSTHTALHEAGDVTEEVLKIAESIYDGWFADGNVIDWDDFIDRMDGATLDDETTLDLGSDMTSPAIAKIKSHVRKYRKLS